MITWLQFGIVLPSPTVILSLPVWPAGATGQFGNSTHGFVFSFVGVTRGFD
jgi:hypothetical protein